MQAAKIEPGTIYALKIQYGEKNPKTYVARFKVTSVESHMLRRGPKATASDYTHKIHGLIDERDIPADLLPVHEDYLKRAVDPSWIEDEFIAYQELVNRISAEKKERDDKIAAANKLRQDLVKELFKLTGLKPVPKNKYSDPNVFKDDYHGVAINDAGIQPLLDALRRLTGNHRTDDT